MLEESAMAKVLIVNPIIRAEDNPRHVPYGLALLAGIANREGHQIQVFDSNGWRPPTRNWCRPSRPMTGT
jgi:anaerobic magnesium-protoporphyrin IX monomethyl ester cyclase